MAAAVSYEVVEGVARIVIERPEVRNAMSLEVFDQLHERAAEAGADDRVGAVLVSGRGGVFSSGIDVSVLGGQTEDGVTSELVDRLQASFTAYEELDKPTVAAIEGFCFGAGIQLAAACHLRAVAPGAELCVMESRWGLVPDLGGTYRLPRLVGLGRATELVLTARRFDAEEALASGFAQLALSDEDPLDEAHHHAARLAAGPGSLRRAPRLLRENLTRDRSTALTAEATAQIACIEGHDFGEAVAAHLEERPPAFVGR